MNTSSGIKAYLSLANVLLFQSPLVKWIFLIGIALASSGGILMSLWRNAVDTAMTTGGCVFIFVSVLMMIVFLPGQILAVNSSKSIFVLPAIKKISLHILFLFSLASACLAAIAIFFFDKFTVFSPLFLAVFFIVSLLLTLTIVISQRWQRFQLTMFIVFISMKHIVTFFESINMMMAIGLNCLLWLSFAVWWQQWRPTRFLKNIVFMTQTEMVKFQQSKRYSGSQSGRLIEGIQNIFKSMEKPVINRIDAIRTHLTGANLGLFGRIQIALLGMVFLAIFILIISLFSTFQKTISAFGSVFYVFIFIMYTSVSHTLLITICRQLPRIWLLYQGSRVSIFSFIEKLYFSAVMVTALSVFVTHLVLCFAFPQIFFEPLFALMLFILGMLVLLIMFYLSIIMYVHPRLGIGWANWVNIAVGIFSLMAVFFAGFNWAEHRSEIFTYALIANGIATVITLLLRIHAINIWPRVNFMRPVN